MNRTNRLGNLLIALFIVLLGATIPVTHAQAQEILTAEQLIRRSVAAIEARDFLTAAMYLQAYVQINPPTMRNNAEHAQQVKAALEYSIDAVKRAISCRSQTTLTCGINEEGLITSIGLGAHGGGAVWIVHQPPKITIPADSSQSGSSTPSSSISPTGQTTTATVLFDGHPNSNRRKVNATFCSGFDSECNFGNCPKNYKLVWGPYCRASDHPYIQPGQYRVTLSGTGTVTAGATDYGTFFNLYGFGQHTITLPGSYTFCWPERAPGGYGFETIVQAGSPNDQITNIRIEYLGPC